jgi:ribose transport system substrate-binding protein
MNQMNYVRNFSVWHSSLQNDSVVYHGSCLNTADAHTSCERSPLFHAEETQRRGHNVSALLCLSLVSFALAGCHRAKQVETIALITPLTTSDMWKGLHAGVFHGCRDSGCVRYWNAPTHEHDFDRQIELMEQERKRNVSGIILAPSDSSALVAAVADSQSSGVPLVIVENSLTMNPAYGIPTIESDNGAAGVLAANAVASLLHEHGTVAIIGFDMARTPSITRLSSFVEELRQHHPGVTLYPKRFEDGSAHPMDETDPEEASSVLSRVDAVFSLNARGTRQYLATQSTGSPRRAIVVACDQDADLLDAVRDGRIDTLIAQNTFEMGRLAVMALNRMKSAARKESQPNVQLAPLTITAKNVDSQAVVQFTKPYSGFDR